MERPTLHLIETYGHEIDIIGHMEPTRIAVPPDEPHHPVHYAATIAETAEQFGVDPGPYLRRARLSRPALYAQDLLISRDQCLTLIRGILGHDIPGFGLQTGLNLRFEDYGMIGYAMYSSATLGRAIERHKRFQPLFQPLVDTRLVVEDDRAILESPVIYPDLEAETDIKRYFVEEHFASWQVISICFQEKMHWYAELHLDFPPPTYAAMYKEFFDCPVYFEQSLSKCVFPRRLLDAPFAFANHREARIIEQRCQSILTDRLHKGGVVGDIHRLLSRSPGRFPHIGDVVTKLGVSERTLRRRLTDEGTTYRRVLTEFRLNLASEYLSTSALPAQEVAVLVGYSEPASFHRAFCKQFGETPDQFRRGRTSG